MTATDPWAAATFSGAERELRRSVAAATPQQRWEWLEDALALALSSGALERARRERQSACERKWSDRPLSQ